MKGQKFYDIVNVVFTSCVQRWPATFSEAFEHKRDELCKKLEVLHSNLLNCLLDSEVITPIHRDKITVW